MPLWLPWALGSAAFAAATALFVKLGVASIPSDFATFLRVLLLVPVLGFIAWATGSFVAPGAIPGRAWMFLALSALATGLSWLCYFRAMSLGEAAKVAPVDKLSVVLVALAGVALLGESLSFRAWAGIALIAGGVVLVATSG
jgi:transporter family protein